MAHERHSASSAELKRALARRVQTCWNDPDRFVEPRTGTAVGDPSRLARWPRPLRGALGPRHWPLGLTGPMETVAGSWPGQGGAGAKHDKFPLPAFCKAQPHIDFTALAASAPFQPTASDMGVNSSGSGFKFHAILASAAAPARGLWLTTPAAPGRSCYPPAPRGRCAPRRRG
jgi:hypothetical protein